MEKPLNNLNPQEKRILNINQQLKTLAKEKITASPERKLAIEKEEQNLHTELEGLKSENDKNPEEQTAGGETNSPVKEEQASENKHTPKPPREEAQKTFLENNGDKTENLVSLKEWTEFVEDTTIEEHTINKILEKIKKREKLSDKEIIIKKFDELKKATGFANRTYTKAVYEKLGILYSGFHRDIPITEIEKTKFYKDNSDLIAQKLTNWNLTMDKVQSVSLPAVYYNGKGWIQVDIKADDRNIMLTQINLLLDENLHSLGKEIEKTTREFNDYCVYIKSFKKSIESLTNKNIKETTSENKEEWTEEDEKTLQNLLLIIENTKKKIEEIENEISEFDENQSDTNNQKTIEGQKDKKSETENEPSPVEKSEETVEKYEEITLDDFKWSYPRNYTDALGSIWINYNDDKCDYHHIEIEKFSTKEVPRTLAGKLIHNSAYKTIKLKEPYCEIRLSKQDPDQPSQQPEVIKVNDIEEAIVRVNELLKNYSIKRASEVDISGNQWVSPLIPYHAQEKITKNIKYFVKERINKEIENDRKEKAFMYYALEKSNNHIITDTLKNETTKVLDLHTIGKDWIGVRIGRMSKINENEGFFDYNIFGFVMIIKNVKELTSEKGIAAESDKAIYKIIGPNEEIIADNVQGYQKATEITWNETEKYKKQVEEEFNKINNNN